MKTNKLKRTNRGFTIIEVMIVLAIAALILLVVFLAVPALQRAQRNNGRKNDVSRISASIVNFVSDNSNAIPDTQANCTSVLSDAGTLDQYTNTTCGANITAMAAGTTIPSNQTEILYNGGTVAATYTNTVPYNAVVIDPGTTCTTAGGGSSVGSATNVSLLYTVESGSGNIWQCLNVQ